MQDKVTFEYAVIRVVPRVEREEFFNVGVILFSKRKKFLGVKYHIKEEFLNAFSSKIDIDFLEQYLQSWKLVCEGKAEGGPIAQFELSDRFRWLAATRSTIIQSSKTHPGLCSNPSQKLEELFNDFVM